MATNARRRIRVAPQVEVVREVPKEVVREVIKEVVREVPVEVPVEVCAHRLKMKTVPSASASAAHRSQASVQRHRGFLTCRRRR